MEMIVVKRGDKVQYEVIRSRRRRRLALTVTDTAQVVVKAPYGISLSTIDSFVIAHDQWIHNRISVIQQLPKPLPEHTFVEGDTFLFLGETLTLHLWYDSRGRTLCERDGNRLIVKANTRAKERAIKHAIVLWYRHEGLSLYQDLVKRWSSALGVPSCPPIHMRAFPKRWGSCSKSGELAFAIRSLMLPYPLVEYLALHETAHLIHFDHGSDFKSTLTLHMPNWRSRQRKMASLRLRVSDL